MVSKSVSAKTVPGLADVSEMDGNVYHLVVAVVTVGTDKSLHICQRVIHSFQLIHLFWGNVIILLIACHVLESLCIIVSNPGI